MAFSTNVIYKSVRNYIKELFIIQKLLSIWKTRSLKHYYTSNAIDTDKPIKTVIFMVDGHIQHGGLCDRLYGLVSTYLFCKENNLDFKVWWKYPFDLELFLQPNIYNWHIDEIQYDLNSSEPYCWGTIHNDRKQYKLAKKILKIKKSNIHAYTNMHYKRELLPLLFKELFKETPILTESIDQNREYLGDDYISVTYRFQQLLGDFHEGNFPILEDKDKNILIEKCIDFLQTIKNENPTISKILVTSDSPTFLQIAQNRYEFVHIITGDSVHMDFIEDEIKPLRHIKPFIELLLISKAKKCYFIRSKKTYPSSFAKTGALIGNREYHEVFID